MPGAMRGILEVFMWACSGTIPVPRARPPRDGEMNYGNQSADMSLIHRRHTGPRVAFPIRLLPASPHRDAARRSIVLLDTKGHMKNLSWQIPFA